ncbi:zinc finger CCCH domain-containing protein 39-like [Lactuca sativa]|uniref:zinc finger CCCH domain-containing protein 39-like n=1 Tax=Lactuca sativa TaxID=4236 RepID=UPI001C689C2C|nr:zinc finger CCCH domain-containing protein 39-like [Lactuca sativa]
MSQHPVNQGTTNIFYKTRICHKFLEGNCGNGHNCTFAHGPKDLREPPPNWLELVKDKGGRDLNDEQRIIYEMKICHEFAKTGECSYGEKCNFLHESPIKFKDQITERTTGDFVIKIQTMVECGQPNGSHIIKVSTASSDHNDKFLKNRICSKWETTGLCALGDKCHFAHGIKGIHPFVHLFLVDLYTY